MGDFWVESDLGWKKKTTKIIRIKTLNWEIKLKKIPLLILTEHNKVLWLKYNILYAI